MTEFLYYQDAYVKEFDAVVTAVSADGIELDRTAFYPGGGGQPSDAGSVRAGNATWPVEAVRKIEGRVWHRVAGDPPGVGLAVQAALDWDRRYALMRTHTAMHILCGVIWRDYGASVTGGNMEPLQGRMDFEFERMQQELVHEIEARINAEVAGRARHPHAIAAAGGGLRDPRSDPHQDQPAAGRHPGGARGRDRRAGLAGRRRDARRQHARGRPPPGGGLQEQGRHQQAPGCGTRQVR